MGTLTSIALRLPACFAGRAGDPQHGSRPGRGRDLARRLSYHRSDRHLDDAAEFVGTILDPDTSPQARTNDLHWLSRIAETVADPGYPV
ncbi:hypothetical protein QQG74_15510 [Micromonospora sp. FIMYZ51]|uniref:hypothetical protein n=1 Tax=Micromonospora sp. FIMYZ51 TaxID=3051832 RepID=UPI00311D2FE2